MKICGLSTPETVDAAVQAGASAIGFVFAPGSPRFVTPELAARLAALVPATAETVGVFRNQPVAEVISTARSAGVATVQLHGDEPLSDLAAVRDAGFRTIRALTLKHYVQDRAAWDAEGSRLLIDSEQPGSGTTVDDALLERSHPAGAWILAGGLDPTTVAARVRATGATGVDVSSGVESSRGVKDAARIRAFVHAAGGVA